MHVYILLRKVFLSYKEKRYVISNSPPIYWSMNILGLLAEDCDYKETINIYICLINKHNTAYVKKVDYTNNIEDTTETKLQRYK